MKIVSSRTLFIKQTNEQTFEFLELLLEPKITLTKNVPTFHRQKTLTNHDQDHLGSVLNLQSPRNLGPVLNVCQSKISENII